MENIFLYNKLKNKNKNGLSIICPSCGSKCSIKENNCGECSYDLVEYRNILFSQYINLYLGYDLVKEERYHEALINISKFLAFYPKDEFANKLNIYILIKLNLIDLAKEFLVKFEEDFPRNRWILEVEDKGLDNIEIPNMDIEKIELSEKENSFNSLNQEYIKYRITNTNEVIELAQRFLDLLMYLKNTNEMQQKLDANKIIEFLETYFISYLSKKEIRVESFEGKIYEDLTQEENSLIDVIGTVKDKTKKEGYIKTIYPAIYLRSKMLVKQKVQVNRIKK